MDKIECGKCGKQYKTKKTLTKHSKICEEKAKSKENINILQDNFTIDKYIEFINNEISTVIKKSKYNDDLLEDILLEDFINTNAEQIKIAKKLKQIQMNVGKIWQISIGKWKDFTDLGEGDETGLDVKSDKLKIIMEIKNRYNTDNLSSRKTNYSKLANYKKAHSDFICIYAVINDKTKEGKDEIIKCDNEDIRYLSGDKLMEYIFQDNKDQVLANLKSQMQILNV
jgi:hypothetical protein